VDTKFVRPKEGEDTCILDLSGSRTDQLKFLLGLKGSRYAPRRDKKGGPRIWTDLETGPVVLINGGDGPRRMEYRRGQVKEVMRRGIEGLDEKDTFEERSEEVYRGGGDTYADLMASQGDLKDGVEEMDWE
jgi:hypothetical protein